MEKLTWKNIKEFLTHKGSVRHFQNSILALLKWGILSVILGCIIGAVGSLFLYAIKMVTAFRLEHIWMVAFLPIGGVFIVHAYHILGRDEDTGTNQVLFAIRKGNRVPLRVAPLILVSTVITHAFGGSVGREGAALQFGGSIGNSLAEFLKRSEDEEKILTMAGMAGAFSALFGAPLGAAVFCLEVAEVGYMHYAALVPCVFTAFVSNTVAVKLGMQSTRIPYVVSVVPNFFQLDTLKCIILGIVCATVGILFILILRRTHRLYLYFFPDKYIRIIAGGVIVAGITLLTGNQDYIGLGGDVIQGAFVAKAFGAAFLLKIIMTALTLEAGYKGGEIVPTLFIGATLGSAVSGLIGYPTGLCAACGMVGLFVSVTNAPVATLILSIELFGATGIEFYSIVIAVSYLVSGYFSLYNEQEITFSKYHLVKHKHKDN